MTQEVKSSLIRKCRSKTKKEWEMPKKYGNKSLESRNMRARSSVGRAPQWHHGQSEKNSPSLAKLNFPENVQVFEIPDGWEPAVAMRMEKGKSVLRSVLLRSLPEKLENDYNGRRRRSRTA